MEETKTPSSQASIDSDVAVDVENSSGEHSSHNPSPLSSPVAGSTANLTVDKDTPSVPFNAVKPIQIVVGCCDKDLSIDNLDTRFFKCWTCQKYYHYECCDSIKSWKNPSFLADDFYKFQCKTCGKGTEQIQRLPLSWADIIHIVLIHLEKHAEPRRIDPTSERKFFKLKQDICDFIEANWSRFWLKPKSSTWRSNMTSYLSVSDRFISGASVFPNESGLWALATSKRPSMMDNRARKTAAFLIDAEGNLVEMPESAQSQRKRTHESDGSSKKKAKISRQNSETSLIDIMDVKVEADSENQQPLENSVADDVSVDDVKKEKPSHKTEEHATIKKDRKKSQKDDKLYAHLPEITMYPDLENPTSDTPVTMSKQPTHSAPQMKITDNGFTVSNDKGYRMAKASHSVCEGSSYFEVTINAHEGNTRIGWSQISGDLQAPCGYDQFSYGYRGNPGTLFYMSRKAEPVTGKLEFAQGYGPGDVLGFHIYLPELSEEERKELHSRIWDPQETNGIYLPFKRRKPLEKRLGSEIRIYKNGVELGVAFRDILNGYYYPCVSCYFGASVTMNFGPDFKFPPNKA